MDKKKNRNPVLLIHGIMDTVAKFNTMRRYLTDWGWEVHTFNLQPNNGSLGLDKLAQQVADYVAKNFGSEQPFDLIGYSMGGLVSRYYIQRLGGINRVQRFITISSPHNGTITANLAWGEGCQQMRPNSNFLNDLNQDVTLLNQINFTSMWTPFDLIIVPPNSSHLPVGKEIILDILIHAWMVQDPRSLAMIKSSLEAPLLTEIISHR
jgi:triacylglycerol lipase